MACALVMAAVQLAVAEQLFTRLKSMDPHAVVVPGPAADHDDGGHQSNPGVAKWGTVRNVFSGAGPRIDGFQPSPSLAHHVTMLAGGSVRRSVGQPPVSTRHVEHERSLAAGPDSDPHSMRMVRKSSMLGAWLMMLWTKEGRTCHWRRV